MDMDSAGSITHSGGTYNDGDDASMITDYTISKLDCILRRNNDIEVKNNFTHVTYT